jgi:hypothetical protein
MESRTIRGVVAAIACALTVCVARAEVLQQTGQYALAQGKPQMVSRLSLVNGANGLQTLVLIQYAPHSTAPLTRYVPTEDEPLHIVIVRDDFLSFGHVHPQMSRSGVFRLPYLLERGHRYYAYVASQPTGLREHVFRFVLASGTAPRHLATSVVAPAVHTRAGPYDVSLDRVLQASLPITWRGCAQFSSIRRRCPIRASTAPSTADYAANTPYGCRR